MLKDIKNRRKRSKIHLTEMSKRKSEWRKSGIQRDNGCKISRTDKKM